MAEPSRLLQRAAFFVRITRLYIEIVKKKNSERKINSEKNAYEKALFLLYLFAKKTKLPSPKYEKICFKELTSRSSKSYNKQKNYRCKL